MGEWFADKKTLCQKMSISSSTFDRYFLNDPRMDSCKYKKGTKLVLWETEKAQKYMKMILSEIVD